MFALVCYLVAAAAAAAATATKFLCVGNCTFQAGREGREKKGGETEYVVH